VRKFVFTARVEEAADVVYARLADFGSYPEFAPSVRGVDLHGASEAEGAESCRSTWEVTFRKGVLRWTETDWFHRDRLTIEFEQEDGDLALLHGRWLVEPSGDHAVINFELEFDLGLPGLETFLEPVAERALLENMEEIVRHLFASADISEAAQPT
jgi:ribosome-associated toxin RatA of RatAB toxin-antitoxin module